MFEHWKAYKNRQNEGADPPNMNNKSRAESFASLVSVIRKHSSYIQYRIYSIYTVSINVTIAKVLLMLDHSCHYNLEK